MIMLTIEQTETFMELLIAMGYKKETVIELSLLIDMPEKLKRLYPILKSRDFNIPEEEAMKIAQEISDIVEEELPNDE